MRFVFLNDEKPADAKPAATHACGNQKSGSGAILLDCRPTRDRSKPRIASRAKSCGLRSRFR